jgi:hypothetical protein
VTSFRLIFVTSFWLILVTSFWLILPAVRLQNLCGSSFRWLVLQHSPATAPPQPHRSCTTVCSSLSQTLEVTAAMHGEAPLFTPVRTVDSITSVTAANSAANIPLPVTATNISPSVQ